jgi:phosphoenolpyruvate phosphomutase
MHGDLVFEEAVLRGVLDSEVSCMAVSAALPLPEKDFKAVLDGKRIRKVGVGFFENAAAAQPLYRLRKEDWEKWLRKIVEFCERGETGVYAENALNELDGGADIFAWDFGTRLCCEIDNPEDLAAVTKKLALLQEQGTAAE